MTLVYLEYAKEAFKQKQSGRFVQEIHRAQDCLQELKASLHMEYEPAPALCKLYLYMHRELARSIISSSEKFLEQPVSILTRLRDVYLELEKTGSWEPVMENAQQVYAGLTYGKGSLVESMTVSDGNRGFLA